MADEYNTPARPPSPAKPVGGLAKPSQFGLNTRRADASQIGTPAGRRSAKALSKSAFVSKGRR